jgi:hypothetical protein
MAGLMRSHKGLFADKLDLLLGLGVQSPRPLAPSLHLPPDLLLHPSRHSLQLDYFRQRLLHELQQLFLARLSLLREWRVGLKGIGARGELAHFGQRHILLRLGVEDVLDQSEQEDNAEEDQQLRQSILHRSVFLPE